jgi:hypothetical protein
MGGQTAALRTASGCVNSLRYYREEEQMAATTGGGGTEPFPLKGRAAGDEDPFPLKLTVKGKGAGKWIKGKGSYGALQIGPFVELVAVGTTPDFNMKAKLVMSPLRIFPPQFGLFFFVPEITLPAEKPFWVDASFFSDDPVADIIVWDADGRHVVPVTKVQLS